MTTTRIPAGYDLETYADVYPRSILMDPNAHRCIVCEVFIQSARLESHRDECPLPVVDSALPACEANDLALAPRSDVIHVHEGTLVTPGCSFCGTTEDLSFEPDPFAADVYNDPTPLWICGPCISDRTDEV